MIDFEFLYNNVLPVILVLTVTFFFAKSQIKKFKKLSKEGACCGSCDNCPFATFGGCRSSATSHCNCQSHAQSPSEIKKDLGPQKVHVQGLSTKK